MKSLYCHECQNYLMGADGECHDCVCGWKQPIEDACDCHTSEVSQSPDAFLHSWRNGCRQKLSKSPTWTKIYHDDQDQPDDLIVSALYLLPPDAEALRKENERLREENKALLDTISMGLASSIKCNCGHLEKYRAEAKKVVDTTLEGREE